MGSTNNEKKRIFGYDVCKVIGAMAIVSVHSMWYSGFYSTPMDGFDEFLIMLLRNLMCSLPLLLYITGALLRHRMPNRMYYFGLFRIVFVYVLSSLIVMWCRHNLFGGDNITFREILDFTATPYGWYISMYLGLFLLAPFLNIFYNNITKKTTNFVNRYAFHTNRHADYV